MTNLRIIGREIHRTNSRIWQLEKARQNVLPYCLRYKTMDVIEELVKSRKQARELRKKREEIKRTTPKTLWYPRRKQQGRNNLRRSEVITQIMKECFKEGWNVKSIAAYFNIGVTPVYRRINIKTIEPLRLNY